MAITTEHSVKSTFQQGTLGDLKALVAAADRAGLPDSSRLGVKHHDAVDQRDDTYTEITVRAR